MKRAILILILCAVFLSACGNAAETAERSVSVDTSAVSQTTTAVTVSAVTSAKEEKDTSWFCQYHLTHFIRTRIMQRERYDHSRAFFELPEAAHRWRCRFFC